MWFILYHDEMDLEEPETPGNCQAHEELGFPPYWVLGGLWMFGVIVGLINMLMDDVFPSAAEMAEQEKEAMERMAQAEKKKDR